jgi:hypothetical protein
MEKLLKLEWATRGTNPTCLHFRIDASTRRARYPNFFFCGNCDKWANDHIICENRKKMSRNRKAYKCKAQHTSFIFATTKIKQRWSLNKVDLFDKAASDSDESEAVCKNVPSPSDLSWIPSNNQELIPVAPETSGQNQEVHPQQLRYNNNGSSPDSTQTNMIKCKPTPI